MGEQDWQEYDALKYWSEERLWRSGGWVHGNVYTICIGGKRSLKSI
jgi:hypothetical protein